jgi:hypothetical protein
VVGFKPDQPEPPTTTVFENTVVVNWLQPPPNGSPITSYRITFRQKDGDFSQDMVNCDGTVTTIILNKECILPFTTLRNAPFSLEFGDSVFAKVVAINYYGESESSDEGNGAIVLLVPDAPTGLADNVAVTTAYVIGFTWNDGMSTGGTPIIDYRVSFDQSTDTWVTLVENVITKSYMTIIPLTPGAFYKFKVEARNSVGHSEYSQELEILCA